MAITFPSGMGSPFLFGDTENIRVDLFPAAGVELGGIEYNVLTAEADSVRQILAVIAIKVRVVRNLRHGDGAILRGAAGQPKRTNCTNRTND
jgi:hypothetical protein